MTPLRESFFLSSFFFPGTRSSKWVIRPGSHLSRATSSPKLTEATGHDWSDSLASRTTSEATSNARFVPRAATLSVNACVCARVRMLCTNYRTNYGLGIDKGTREPRGMMVPNKVISKVVNRNTR